MFTEKFETKNTFKMVSCLYAQNWESSNF